MFLAFVRTLSCESALMEFLLDRGDRVCKENWLGSLVKLGVWETCVRVDSRLAVVGESRYH